MSDTNNTKDTYGYSKMTAVELRKVITDLTRDTLTVQEDKKAYVGGVNDVVKENNKRVKVAVEALKVVEQNGVDKVHEKKVAEFLKAVTPS